MKAEAELQHLFKQLTGILDPEGANTMIDVISPFARNELATKNDMALLRSDFVEFRGEMRLELREFRSEVRAEIAEVRVEMGRLKSDLLRSLVGWFFLSQAALVTIVALIVSLA